MARMNNLKRLAASLLLGVLAASASAQNGDNNGNRFGNENNSGNHFGNTKANGNYSADGNSYVIAVTEPAALALLGAGAATLGVAMILRRRKR